MQVREIMSNNLVCCTPDTSLADVARLMVEHDCGQIPVVGPKDRKPVGVVTDRDIACRTVAQGRNPLNLAARDCMSSPVVSVSVNADVDECCQTMAELQVRRLPVINEAGECCGIVAQADIARVASEKVAGHVVREVSRETPAPSRTAS
jgi:CBS-domain-containing membrane protein